MKYVPHFAGYVSLDETGKSFIKDVRKLLRLSGFCLWVRGGNPNRKQFSENRWDHKALRQSLPLKHSTYSRLYIRTSYLNTFSTNAMSMEQCKGVVKAVRKIYNSHGQSLTKNVPVELV